MIPLQREREIGVLEQRPPDGRPPGRNDHQRARAARCLPQHVRRQPGPVFCLDARKRRHGHVQRPAHHVVHVIGHQALAAPLLQGAHQVRRELHRLRADLPLSVPGPLDGDPSELFGRCPDDRISLRHTRHRSFLPVNCGIAYGSSLAQKVTDRVEIRRCVLHSKYAYELRHPPQNPTRTSHLDRYLPPVPPHLPDLTKSY